jgi:hypothetical protein
MVAVLAQVKSCEEVVVFDFDNTLVGTFADGDYRDTRLMSDGLLAAMERLHRRGVPLWIMTARNHPDKLDKLELLINSLGLRKFFVPAAHGKRRDRSGGCGSGSASGSSADTCGGSGSRSGCEGGGGATGSGSSVNGSGSTRPHKDAVEANIPFTYTRTPTKASCSDGDAIMVAEGGVRIIGTGPMNKDAAMCVCVPLYVSLEVVAWWRGGVSLWTFVCPCVPWCVSVDHCAFLRRRHRHSLSQFCARLPDCLTVCCL